MADTAFPKREKSIIVTGMDGIGDLSTRTKSRAKAKRRFAPALKAVFGAVAVLLVLFVAGFLFFCSLLMDTPANIGQADAIVALTGGEARIPEAVRLLSKARGKRLLISGVNPVTTRKELARLVPDSKAWFKCCIDVGWMARNTIGNAEETRIWVQERGFNSLIVVTASYHMPRSLAELRRTLPDIKLVPYPVEPRNLHVRTWWAYPGTLQLLVSEYVKFIPTLGRCTVSQISHGHGFASGMRRCLNGGHTD